MISVARAVLLILLIASFGFSTTNESLQPSGWDSHMKLREAVDKNPDPHVMEIDLDARVAPVPYEPGRQVEAWTYDGDIPGPLIRLQVGDRLIVHFTNHLPQPTTVHWHGLRIPLAMDGVPGHSQPEVPTGGSFTYNFVVPDAGLFWYHPHVMSAMQVGYGLYGALLVEDPAERVGITDEIVLVLSDIAIGDKGGLDPPNLAGQAGMAFGLEGNYVFVNGRVRPTMTARAGVAQRWRIVNTAKSKYFAIQLTGSTASPSFTIIGGDGGLQEFPTTQELLVIAPGERVDTVVVPMADRGEDIVVQSMPFNRGYGSEYVPIQDLFTIHLTGAAPAASLKAISVRRDIVPIPTAKATAVDMDLSLVQVNDSKIEYRINNTPGDKLKPFRAAVGETQIWTITNRTKWSHPVHLHGFFFQVLDENGVPAHPLAWKDTVDVPFESTLRLVVRFDDRPGGAEGSWMLHCHILDHAEGGLMTMVEVVSADGSAPPHATHH